MSRKLLYISLWRVSCCMDFKFYQYDCSQHALHEYCWFSFPVFNISRAHQIEKNRRENGSCFAVSSFLVCDSIHHALQSDLNDRAIWLKTRGHLRQFVGWFDADCVVFQHDYMLWFALFFVMFWLSMLYKRPKTGRFSGSRCFRFQIRELWESNCNDNSKDETSFLILAFFFSFLML